MQIWPAYQMKTESGACMHGQVLQHAEKLCMCLSI